MNAIYGIWYCQLKNILVTLKEHFRTSFKEHFRTFLLDLVLLFYELVMELYLG